MKTGPRLTIVFNELSEAEFHESTSATCNGQQKPERSGAQNLNKRLSENPAIFERSKGQRRTHSPAVKAKAALH